MAETAGMARVVIQYTMSSRNAQNGELQSSETLGNPTTKVCIESDLYLKDININ